MIKFLKGKISKKNIKSISKSFNDLPKDEYLKFVNINFRNRRFSKVLYENNKFINKKETVFTQSKSRNKYLGGIVRKYYPVKYSIIQNINSLIKQNFYFIIYNKKVELGYHQIRITCGENYVGHPVPEGWHKDGFDYVSLINFTSKNISGGISRIRNEIHTKKDIDNYSCFLNSGEFLFFCDKEFFHFTDPIIVKNNKFKGYRDTLVVTFKIL
jgi:hypothetical protein